MSLSRRTLARAGLALVTALGIALSLGISREGLVVILLLFVIVVPFEKLVPRHPDQKVRRAGLGTDLAHGLLLPLTGPIGIAAAVLIGVLSLAWLPGLALRPLVGLVPAMPRAIIGLLMFDAVIYWTHRFSHEVPLLWRFHAIHHSTEDLDWVSGLRNHPLDGVVLAPAFFFLIAAGFSPEYAGVLTIIQIVAGFFLHANVRWRLRPIHRIVITPEFHHWHHSNEPMAMHSNYSVFLPLWDILFGTYFMPSNRRPEVYGVNEFIPTTVAGQLLWPLRGMGNPVGIVWRALRSPVSSLRWLTGQTANLVRQMRASVLRPTGSVVGVVPRPPQEPGKSRLEMAQSMG